MPLTSKSKACTFEQQIKSTTNVFHIFLLYGITLYSGGNENKFIILFKIILFSTLFLLVKIGIFKVF